MRVLRADSRTHSWRAPHGAGSFRPNGKKHFVGNPSAFAHNASKRWGGASETLAARIFVGFNVGGEPRWTLGHLIEIVQRVRRLQGHAPDSSFVAQKGIYTSRLSGETITEDGAQVILIDLEGLPLEQFEQEMMVLAGEIAGVLEQEEVILEIQRNGLSIRTFGVGP